MKAKLTLLAAICGLTFSSAFAQAADTIYTNDSILTMAGKSPAYVEALAVKDGEIALAGIRVVETLKEGKIIYPVANTKP